MTNSLSDGNWVGDETDDNTGYEESWRLDELDELDEEDDDDDEEDVEDDDDRSEERSFEW